LVGCVLLLAGALAQQPSSRDAKPPTLPKTDNKPESPKPVVADPKAVALLDAAIKGLDPKRRSWLQTTIWQQATLQGLTFEVDGRYLAGPNHRQHLDLSIHLGDTIGRLEFVSDGTTLWDIRQVGNTERLVTKKVLTKELDTAGSRSVVDQVRDEFYRAESFTGVAPLLEGIRQRMTVHKHEAVSRDGRDMIRLTANWSPDALKAFPQSDKQWIPFLPKQCRLYLVRLPDDILWPHRVEWWGPAPPYSVEALLLQMEFRDPKFNQALPDDQGAREFTFQPVKNDLVRDLTKELTEGFKDRARKLAAQTPGQ
jgi:hypothetical protein